MKTIAAVRACALILILGVGACGERGHDATIAPSAALGPIEPVFISTSRDADVETGAPFGFARSAKSRFARYDVAIPPDRQDGEIGWPVPGRKTNPATEFLSTARQIYPDAASFRADLRRSLGSHPKAQREVIVFVHGFNTNFVEGVYRVAQLGHDLGTNDVLVHYSWPSRANALGYVYDRDSVLFARDGLQRLLEEVIGAGAERILIVGHSLGGALTMETLRQIAISGDKQIMAHISGVVLISPDIDLDVFRSQAQRIGTLPQPFVIFTNRKDRALALSGRLTGEGQRLGNVKDLSEIGNLDVTLIDTSAYSVGTGHFNVGNSPTLIALLGRVGQIDRALTLDSRRSGLLPGVVLTIRNATEIILTPVTTIATGGR